MPDDCMQCAEYSGEDSCPHHGHEAQHLAGVRKLEKARSQAATNAYWAAVVAQPDAQVTPRAPTYYNGQDDPYGCSCGQGCSSGMCDIT